MEWYKMALNKYSQFSGRSRRSEYWYFLLFNMIFTVVAVIIDSILWEVPILYLLYSLGVFIPGLAVTIRRLHDTNKSGWWMLISIIPLIGAIVILVFLATEGDHSDNQYGPNPKSTSEEDHISQHLV